MTTYLAKFPVAKITLPLKGIKGPKNSMQMPRHLARDWKGLFQIWIFFISEWNLVIWKHLYKTNSQKDIGTLYAARNAINSRNVTKDPHNNFYACEEFLDKFTQAYIINGAYEYFELDPNDENSKGIFPSVCFDKKKSNNERLKALLECVVLFVSIYTNYNYPAIALSAPVNLQLQCRICDKQYNKGPLTLKSHEREKHNYPPEEHKAHKEDSKSSSNQDHILNYTKCAMTLLLLRLNLADAIKMGDGYIMYRDIELMYWHFKASGCYKLCNMI